MFRLMNQETGFIEYFTLESLLEMINRDRSNDWTDYGKDDTLQQIYEVINDMCAPYSTDIKE